MLAGSYLMSEKRSKLHGLKRFYIYCSSAGVVYFLLIAPFLINCKAEIKNILIDIIS